MRLTSLSEIQLTFHGTDFSPCAARAKSQIIHWPQSFAQRCHRAVSLALLWVFLGGSVVSAETGREAWLRYPPLNAEQQRQYTNMPARIVMSTESPVLEGARNELIRGLSSLLARKIYPDDKMASPAIVLGTLESIQKGTLSDLRVPRHIDESGFWLKSQRVLGGQSILIVGKDDRGVLYGVFDLLGRISQGQDISALNEVQNPGAKIRWVDQWDNLDGTIERGYAGHSIFFDRGNVWRDLTRAAEYARLLASIGINGCNINNVNADPRVLEKDFLPQIARIANVFRPWGVRL